VKIHIFLFSIVLFCISCTTLFNRRTQKVHITTSVPTKVTVNKHTYTTTDTLHHIRVDRKRGAMLITATSDSTVKMLALRPHISPTYWINSISPYGIGFLIDLTNPKRYAYPRHIYLDMKGNNDMKGNKTDIVDTSRFYSYPPSKSFLPSAYKNSFKITPMKLLGRINPGIELAYERKTSNYFSTTVFGSYLISPLFGYNRSHGYKIGVEEKFYLAQSAMQGPYLSLLVDYFTKKHEKIAIFNNLSIIDSIPNYRDTINIHQSIASLCVKLGYQYIYKQLAVDVYIGAGVQYRDIKYTDQLNPNHKEDRFPMFSFYPPVSPGIRWWVRLPINIRVGWAF
jgi:hypothetical protein